MTILSVAECYFISPILLLKQFFSIWFFLKLLFMTAVKSLSPPTLRRLRFEVTSYTFYTWESNLDTAIISGASSKQPVSYRFLVCIQFLEIFWSQQAKLLYYIRIPPDGDIELVR